MTSAQDHALVTRELSGRRQQDPQPTLETPRDPSPPRFSQLHDPQPDATESNPSRRATSTATNPSTLVNQPGAVGSSTGPTNSGVQNASATQDRIHQPTSLPPDRRAPTWFDHIRGENTGQGSLPDDGEHDRRFSSRRISIPRPLPVFGPSQDPNENRNGSTSRVGLRGFSGPEWNLDPQEFREPPQPMEKTVFKRMEKTHQAATAERDKYKRKARQQSLLINGAIGAQVIVGAITTGVAAGSKNIGSSVAVLGGISTALASFLAKARGSGEPEFSKLRARELNTFLRELDAFIMDHGDKVGSEFDYTISMYRERFELIIRTEGEDSTGRGAFAALSRQYNPMEFRPANQQPMPGTFGARGHQPMPPQPSYQGPVQPNEKPQMSKNEKALSGMV